MINIIIPEHLGISTPADKPIVQLAAELYVRGYELKSDTAGNLVAKSRFGIENPCKNCGQETGSPDLFWCSQRCHAEEDGI